MTFYDTRSLAGGSTAGAPGDDRKLFIQNVPFHSGRGRFVLLIILPPPGNDEGRFEGDVDPHHRGISIISWITDRHAIKPIQ
ncbi:hypothetical protein CRI94_00235 [Longibacter salinarum]|uniref:Uncharacterized protein n=1 Tax=Longibacter salinarum TaxID=1850348 RepID=A0A2A8D1J7_9BACT|nr:hypothetical protein CRI94_00235 [Longibacter salinarum]